MAIADDLASETDSILARRWDVTDGTVIPNTEDIKLDGGSRKLDVVMFYADLADSTALVSYDRLMAAKIFKTFLACCTRLIRHNDGEIRSFDGDRVMGVYIGKAKHSSAGKTALQVKWAFDTILRPKIIAQYDKLRDGTLRLDYSAGIDTGEALVVRAGIRGNNDLLFVGRVANIAAKLSAIRQDPYRSFITERVFNRFREDVKLGPKGEQMWERCNPWKEAGVIYRSKWSWKP